ncbi:MAG: hypothetical protein JWO94_2335 [Verrucomicrobiaceae bacterium]|nr:hypothetical protein [Verrucomicrobiaceae bacterium]
MNLIDPAYLPLLDVLGKGLALLLLAFLVQHAMQRPASAAQRSLAWFVVFVALAILPASLLVKPRWALTVAQAKPSSLPALVAPIMSLPVEVVPLAMPAVLAPWWQRLTLAQWGFAVWVGGGMLVLGFRVIGTWQIQRLHRTSRPLENKRLNCHLDGLADELGVSRAIDVRLSAHTAVPLTWGWLKPVLLMPAGATGWDDEKLDAALRHELGHMRHRDAFTRWHATIVCAFWWPLPLVWIAFRMWRIEQEKACDDLVISAGAVPQEYAMQLLDAARSLTPHSFAAMAMARPSTLETRLRAVMDEQRNRRPMGARAWAFSAGTALLLSSICLLAQLRAAQPGGKAELIVLTTEILQAPKGTLRALLKAPPAGDSSTTLMDQQEWQALRLRLHQSRGAAVLSSPSVTTHSNVAAVVEVDAEKISTPDGGRPPSPNIKVIFEPSVSSTGLHLGLKMQVRQLIGMKDSKPAFQETNAKASVDMADDKVVLLTGMVPANPDNELFCFVTQKIIPDTASEMTKDASASTAETKAAQIILKSVVFSNATPEEAFEYFRVKSRELDPAKAGLKIVVSDKIPATQITLSLKDVPLKEALQYCVRLSNMEVSYTPDAAVVHKPGRPPAMPLANSDILTPAKDIILPRWKFVNATLEETLDYLRIKSRDLDPAKVGLNIVLMDKPSTTSISLDLHDVTVLEAARFCASLAHMEVSYAPGTLMIHKPGRHLPAAPEEAAAVIRAKEIILPRVDFADATVPEIVEFLREKTRDFDPKHEDINFIYKDGGTPSSAKITLALTNVPLSELLTYVAELGNLKLETDGHTIVLTPKSETAVKAVPKVSLNEAALSEAVDKLLPAKGVHLKSCTLKEGHLIIIGEAVTQALAGALRQDLKRAPAFAGFQWDFPPPAVTSNGFVSFRAEGVPVAAGR